MWQPGQGYLILPMHYPGALPAGRMGAWAAPARRVCYADTDGTASPGRVPDLAAAASG